MHRLSLAMLVCVASPAAGEDDVWLIVPGERAGAITATSSEGDLRNLFGGGKVRPGLVELGEGVREEGTIVFPDDPERRIEILWADKTNRRHLGRVQITGAKSAWHLADGITLGTTLRELERLNGRAFLITGFGWDYGGTIVSWEGGALSQPQGAVFLRLTPDYTDPRDLELEKQVMGDRDFPSSHAAMQGIDPTVEQIVLDFPPTAASP